MEKHKNELIMTARRVTRHGKRGYMCDGSADFSDVHEYAAAIASCLEAITKASKDGQRAVLLAVMEYLDKADSLEAFTDFMMEKALDMEEGEE